MKKLFILTAFLMYQLHSSAQNKFPANGSVGIGTTSPNSSSILEVKSTKQGVLLPRMTKAQRDSIAAPAEGLFIYQTDNIPGLYYYNNGWKSIVVNAANKSLSNLAATTAVNVDFLPGTTGAKNLGSGILAWKDLYLSGAVYLNGLRFIHKSGSYCTFVGDYAGILNTGDGNSGVGYDALRYNTTGYNNTALGVYGLKVNTTGRDNVAVGYLAMKSSNGSFNTAVGSFASSIDVGDGNTAIGYNTGLTKTSYSIFIGYGTYGAAGITNSVAIGTNAYVNQSNKVVIGNTNVTSIGGYVNWTNFSDGRYKQNKKADVPGLSFIRELKPITYTLDIAGIDNFIKKVSGAAGIRKSALNSEEEKLMNEAKEAKSKIRYSGFVAQDVEDAAKKLGYDFSGVSKPKDNTDFYGLRYADFVVPVVKALQELDEENKMLKKELEEIKQMIAGSQNSNTLNSKIISGNSAYLQRNYPNPSGRSTIIPVHLPKGTSAANIIITEISSGKAVKTIPVTVNTTQVSLQTDSFANGMYSYSLIADGKKLDTKQMMVAK